MPGDPISRVRYPEGAMVFSKYCEFCRRFHPLNVKYLRTQDGQRITTLVAADLVAPNGVVCHGEFCLMSNRLPIRRLEPFFERVAE